MFTTIKLYMYRLVFCILIKENVKICQKEKKFLTCSYFYIEKSSLKEIFYNSSSKQNFTNEIWKLFQLLFHAFITETKRYNVKLIL